MPKYDIEVEKVFVTDVEMTNKLNAYNQKQGLKEIPFPLRTDYKKVDVHVPPTNVTATMTDVPVNGHQQHTSDFENTVELPLFNKVIGGAIGVSYKIVEFSYKLLQKML